MSALLFLLVVLGMAAAAEAVYYLARYVGQRPGDELRRRLHTVGERDAGLQLVRRRRLANREWLEVLLDELPPARRLERLLEQTDSTMTVGALLGRTTGLALLGVLLAALLGRPLLAVLFAPALGAVPLVLVLDARGKRARKVSQQLPDALDMMARAVKAGHALPASFKLVAQECPPPVAVEFGKAYEQQNLGLSLDAAVHAMTERVPECLDLKLLAVSVRVQTETGGNLVEVLEKISETMRERFKFYSKLRAVTAEARISGIILGVLPFVVAVVIALTNRGYLAELSHGLGRWILAAGITLWLVGTFWIHRLTKVVY